MRRSAVLMVVLATVLVIAVPASAKKGAPGPPDQDPVAGTTCVSPWWEGDIHDSDGDGWSNDFELVLTAENADACVDVLTEVAGTWRVTVLGSGARSMTIVPRDAAGPGDSCGGQARRGDAVYDTWVLPHPNDVRFDVIPASTVNACPGDDESGVGDFAETIERLAPDGSIEAEIVFGPTAEIHPLALQVFTQGIRRNDTVTVFIDLPGVGS